MEKIATSVEKLEAEARLLLEKARQEAEQILIKTKEECSSITSSALPLVESSATCENVILVAARAEATRIAEESNRRVAEIKNVGRQKMREIVVSIVTKVTGDRP